MDRHESLCSIDELLSWKALQVADAGAGTAVSDADIRTFERLLTEERGALAQLARLVQRLISLSERAQVDIDQVRARNEQARLRTATGFGPVWEIDEDGRNEALMSTDRFRLSRADQGRWDQQIRHVIIQYSESVIQEIPR